MDKPSNATLVMLCVLTVILYPILWLFTVRPKVLKKEKSELEKFMAANVFIPVSERKW